MRRLRLLPRLLADAWLGLITYMPGPLGFSLRRSHYKRRLKFLGKGVILDVGVQISQPDCVSIDDNTWIDKYVVILAGKAGTGERKMAVKENAAFAAMPGEVIIGRNCHIAAFSILVGHGGIAIGDNCTVASGAKIYSLSHHYRNPRDAADTFAYSLTSMAPESHQSLFVGPVVMETNSFLALNSVMLPGSTLGANTVVGIGSVVLDAIPPDTIAGGNPAGPLKSRFSA